MEIPAKKSIKYLRTIKSQESEDDDDGVNAVIIIDKEVKFKILKE